MTQWNLLMVKADKALQAVPRVGGQPDWGGVKVAQFDTGYREHPALGFAGGASPFCDATRGRDFFQPRRSSALDPLTPVAIMPVGHGTRSGSALCGQVTGLESLAPGLPYIPFRVTNHSVLASEGALAVGRALDAVIALVAAGTLSPIVNISLGRPFGDRAMGAAVDRAYEAGVLILCAGGQEFDHVVYPAKYARTIGVGGIEQLRSGRCVVYQDYVDYARIDTWAPADPIQRADLAELSAPFGTGDGTTYATVHVTAAAAYWWRKRGPEILTAYPEGWMRVEAFRLLLRETGAALPLTTAIQAGLKTRGNLARLLDIKALVQKPLPKPAVLQKRADLAVNEMV